MLQCFAGKFQCSDINLQCCLLQGEPLAVLDTDDVDRCNIDDLPDPDKYYGPAASDEEEEDGESSEEEDDDGSDSELTEESDSEGDVEESDEDDRCGCVVCLSLQATISGLPSRPNMVEEISFFEFFLNPPNFYFLFYRFLNRFIKCKAQNMKITSLANVNFFNGGQM